MNLKQLAQSGTAKIFCATGHRPNRIRYGNFNAYDPEVYNRLVRLCIAALKHYKPDVMISGMALGFDQAIAEAAIELDIPLVAAIPFEGQSSNWPEYSQQKYNRILSKASKRVVVCDGSYKPFKMIERNHWMCDRATHMIALHNEIYLQGGTAECMGYMQKTYPDKPIYNIYDKWAT